MASQSNRSLGLLNTSYTTQKGTGTFLQFSTLPPELRSRIWEQSLCQERMIRVELRSRRPNDDVSDDRLQFQTLPESGSTPEVRDFDIVLTNNLEISKLFRVCVESRQAALRFYRVQLPCFYEHPAMASWRTKRTFYFNPELDILQITGHSRDQIHLPKFADLLWEHDPRRVGLVNLALLKWTIRSAFDELLHAEDEILVRQFLSRLRTVYLGYTGDVESSLEARRAPGLHRGWTASNTLPSRPLMAFVSNFQRLRKDPRSIENDLRTVSLGGGDPRDRIYHWFRLLRRWKIEYPRHTVDYRFLITTCTQSCNVTTQEHALQYFQDIERLWQRGWTLKERETTPVDAQSTFPVAIGFWLFPITAFGPIPEPEETEAPFTWKVRKMLDLSGCTPELCLQSLWEAKVSRSPWNTL